MGSLSLSLSISLSPPLSHSSSRPTFLPQAKLFRSANTHSHTLPDTPLAPCGAEPMQQEMKYLYLRGKHTSFHTTRGHTCVEIHAYTSTALIDSGSGIPCRNNTQTSKTIFCVFHGKFHTRLHSSLLTRCEWGCSSVFMLVDIKCFSVCVFM